MEKYFNLAQHLNRCYFNFTLHRANKLLFLPIQYFFVQIPILDPFQRRKSSKYDYVRKKCRLF